MHDLLYSVPPFTHFCSDDLDKVQLEIQRHIENYACEVKEGEI